MEEVGVVFPRETRPAGARGPTQRVGSLCVQPRFHVNVHTCTDAHVLSPNTCQAVAFNFRLSNRLLPGSRWTGTSLQNTSHSRLLPRRLPLPTLTHLLHGGESLSLSPPLTCSCSPYTSSLIAPHIFIIFCHYSVQFQFGNLMEHVRIQ